MIQNRMGKNIYHFHHESSLLCEYLSHQRAKPIRRAQSRIYSIHFVQDRYLPN